jgi:acyl-CoA thioester hydrolase
MRSASVEITVPFHDVDAMEVAWHGHYLKYLELARCALLDTFDYNYPQMKASGYAWPVVELKVRYLRPAAFGQRLQATATLAEWENRLKIDYELHDLATGERLTSATTIQVAVDVRTREMCFASPDVLFHKLGLPLP